MRAVLLKIGALLMALIVLFSTMSFTINAHYCSGTLFDTSIFEKVQNCGMDSDVNQKQNSSIDGCSNLKDNCCEDKQIAIEGQNELRILIYKSNLDQQLFVSTILHLLIELESFTQRVQTQNYCLQQSPLAISIYKLNEAYLI